jgi:hypothetical protein
MATSEKHWGKWVVDRSRLLGFRSQKELAAEIGCTEEQLSRWVQLRVPPAQMRKGFDRLLAATLELPRETLFVKWEEMDPARGAFKVSEADIRQYQISDIAAELLTRCGPKAYSAVMRWLRSLKAEELQDAKLFFEEELNYLLAEKQRKDT